jgi:hypothetical protein
MASTQYAHLGIYDENRNPSKPPKQSVLKSLMPSKAHRRNASRQDVGPTQSMSKTTTTAVPLLPADHPHTSQHRNEERGRVKYDAGFKLPADYPHSNQAVGGSVDASREQQPLGERAMNRDDSGEYRRMVEAEREKEKNGERGRSRGRGLHKKTKSVVSLRSLVGGGDKKDKGEKDKESRASDEEERGGGGKMKKSKSSTSLSALLSKPRSSRSRKRPETREKDKENMTPPSSSGEVRSPIWAQFATQPFQDPNGYFEVPGSGAGSRPGTGKSIEEEMGLYTPKEYSPSKQRNFHWFEAPTLSRRPGTRERPKSEYVLSSTSGSLFTEHMGDAMRKENRSVSPRKEDRESRPPSSEKNTDAIVKGKRTSRVMAQVAALDRKSMGMEAEKLDPKEIENAFEKLLVSRVPDLGLLVLMMDRIREIFHRI